MKEQGKLMKFLLTQKLRFDIGLLFFTLFNFALVAVATSERVGSFLAGKGVVVDSGFLLGVLLFMGFIGTWGLGFYMDKRLKYYQEFTDIQNNRNVKFTEVLENTRVINQKLDLVLAEFQKGVLK